ncbi:hypothetical protein CC80DRAFT_312165 [Byssothecium circinans]|uniref:Uncharacterized protein n=1 Tax=Byssothecium circinans TaxID=147558 RepID=A0A6A5U7P5_9PLEO|nr:hypothetical protein CC80DRAFT_312165 [Byssothecium circinans]
MSKRNSDGDVVANMMAVRMAQTQNQIASWLGEEANTGPSNATSKQTDNDGDLKQNYIDDEPFGVGALLPNEVEDGSFTNRVPKSTDFKLLEQLIGKQAANVHLQKKTSNANTKPQAQSKPQLQRKVAKEESEDEEEGRASAFTSKRRKVERKKVEEVGEEDGDADEERTAKISSKSEAKETSNKGVDDNDSEDKGLRKSTAKSRPQKAKKASYLDELLAERSKKKKKKSKSKADA